MHLIIFIILFPFLIIPFALGKILSVPQYKGPISDHFNGKKFFNPDGPSKGFKELIKWARNREKGSWIEIKETEYGPPPPRIIEGNKSRITFVNHSTFLIQTAGMNILTDPIWSKRASPFQWTGPKRMKPPGIKMSDLPKTDIILLSHNHYDHLDIEALRSIYQKHQPTIYTALGVSRYLERKGIGGSVDMDWWDELHLKEGISLIATPARHFSGRGMFDRDTTLWCGFALKSKQGSIFFAGDTGYASFFSKLAEKIGPVKVSLLPIGAYKPEWFMSPIHTSPDDAARIHLEIGSEFSIGTHFGTFPLADDCMTDPIHGLKTALINHNIPVDKFIALKEGNYVEF